MNQETKIEVDKASEMVWSSLQILFEAQWKLRKNNPVRKSLVKTTDALTDAYNTFTEVYAK